MNRTKAHNDLVQDILIAISQFQSVRAWSNPTGYARAMSDTDVIVKYGMKGSADIIGIFQWNGVGLFLAIEVKTGTARQTVLQKNFMAMIRRLGGVYIVARNLKQALDAIEQVLQKGPRAEFSA